MWADIAGSTSPDYTSAPLAIGDVIRVRVVVSNELGTVTSAAVTGTGVAAPVLVGDIDRLAVTGAGAGILGLGGMLLAILGALALVATSCKRNARP